MNKTDAQQARRILDRLVGYEISPILWNKVQRGLSAGRVQSVAVRLVCEREDEIKAFKPEEYWSVDVTCRASQPPPFEARIWKLEGREGRAEDRGRGRARSRPSCAAGAATVATVDKKERRKKPQAPFITSRLQQDAARKLRFSRQAHDGARAASLRRRRARRRGPDRSHHLHAYRLDARLRRRADRGARVHHRAPTAPSTCPRRRTPTATRSARRTPTRRSARR